MRYLFDGPSSLQVGVESGARSLKDALSEYTDSWGVRLVPGNSIPAAISKVPENGVIILMPGTYKLSTALDINKKVSIRGFGRVILEGISTTMIILSAAGCELRDVYIRPNVNSVGNDAAVDMTGNQSKIIDCTIESELDHGINVTGDNCVVRGCSFQTTASISTVGDIYWADNAENGQAYGNIHSTTRDYVLDYRTADNMSQSANGRSAIINAR